MSTERKVWGAIAVVAALAAGILVAVRHSKQDEAPADDIKSDETVASETTAADEPVAEADKKDGE